MNPRQNPNGYCKLSNMKKQRSRMFTNTKLLILTVLTTSLIMGMSIIALYLSTRANTTVPFSQCQGATNSISGDGLIVVNEADLGCFGKNYRLQASKENEVIVSNIALIIGMMSLVINITLIIHVHKRA